MKLGLKLKRWLPSFLYQGERSGRLDAFTLVEMLVVTGMLGILLGVAAGGLGTARAQARVTKANVEVRELVNAWLSYEASYDDWPAAMNEDELEATEDNLKGLMGEEDGIVYLNAPIVNGAFRDPWGTPYRFRVVTQDDIGSEAVEDMDEFQMSVTFPNRERYYGRQ